MARDWKEAQEKRINIADVEPEIFEGYLNWMYSKEVTLKSNAKLCDICKGRKGAAHQCEWAHSLELAKMYVLGDYLNDIRFCNAVVDTWKSIALEAACRSCLDTIQFVWSQTSSDCPIRDLVLESWKDSLTEDKIGDYIKSAESMSKDFAVDFLVFLANCYETQIERDTSPQKSPFKKKCMFHKHVKSSDKCS